MEDNINNFSNCNLSAEEIENLLKEKEQTNLGINDTILQNNYIRFPDDLTIFGYGKNGELSDKYICYTNNLKKILNMNKYDIGIVSGFGATNAPTVGTLSMILKLIELQKNTNLYTYVIINDLGSINARHIDPRYVLELTDHYKDFLIKMGFNTKNGEIRTHNDIDHARTFSIVSSLIKLEDFMSNTEATDDTYNRLNLRGNDFSAMVDHVYTATDVLLPILKDKKNGIIVPCGLEEFYHANIGGIALQRMAQNEYYKSFIPDNVEVGAIYSKLIDGFYPYFKQSKSIVNASLYLNDDINTIKSKIIDCNPYNEYVIMQMISQATNWPIESINAAQLAFDNMQNNYSEWLYYKQKFCEWFIDIKKIWESYDKTKSTNLNELLYQKGE